MTDHIRKLWWKFRYARYMLKRSEMPWEFCWESATISMNDALDPGEWKDEDPTDCASEEMSCWSD